MNKSNLSLANKKLYLACINGQESLVKDAVALGADVKNLDFDILSLLSKSYHQISTTMIAKILIKQGCPITPQAIENCFDTNDYPLIGALCVPTAALDLAFEFLRKKFDTPKSGEKLKTITEDYASVCVDPKNRSLMTLKNSIFEHHNSVALHYYSDILKKSVPSHLLCWSAQASNAQTLSFALNDILSIDMYHFEFAMQCACEKTLPLLINYLQAPQYAKALATLSPRQQRHFGAQRVLERTLMSAIKVNNTPVINSLISTGVSPYTHNCQALCWAVVKKNTDLQNNFLSSNKHLPRAHLNRSLSLAISQKNAVLAQTLIAKGASVFYGDHSLFKLACKNKDTECLTVLFMHTGPHTRHVAQYLNSRFDFATEIASCIQRSALQLSLTAPSPAKSTNHKL